MTGRIGISDMLWGVKQGNGKFGRRDFLKAAAAAMSMASISKDAMALPGSRSTLWISNVLSYLEGLRRADGGYAWPDQPRSHLTSSFAAIGCYHLLERVPPNKKSLVEFVRTHHPFRIKKLERDLKVFEFQQIQSLLWLGEDAGSFREQVKSWRKPSVYPRQYEQDGYPILRFEVMALLCRRLLGLSTDDISAELIEYIDIRRRGNGSFNNTPAGEGGDGHVMNTWWGLQALAALNRSGEKREETIAWVQGCQLADGGFTYQPKPTLAGIADITYAWAAARILEIYGVQPARRKACIEYVLSLRNEDGGFGDRQGWPSNPVATYRGLDIIRGLGGFELLSSSRRRQKRRAQRRRLPKDLRIFTIQIEAHGKGSPADAVELARALRIDLWGAKNSAPGWIAAAQAVADRRKVPVTFFVANEEYGTFVRVPGLGTYSHTSDIIAPANVEFGPSPAGGQAVSWEEFRRRRLVPLQKAGGRLIWQFNENEELTRLYLDDSLKRGGYAAISTFHFGNPDFTNSEPFLKHYWQQIPFVALQDAHGNEPWWWGDQLTGFRTLFLAKEPTWSGWLKALEENWVVAVRYDSVSGYETWMHGGVPEAVEFVRGREQQWRWWDNPRIKRPLVSIVAVKPNDQWETARPKRGVTVRVRCCRDNTLRGLPKAPRIELIELFVDGRKVVPKLVAPKAQWGAYRDYYHFCNVAQPAPGRHTATAVVRSLKTQTVSKHTIEFII
ncbi:MAG: terpene cyclase/mutase family protein [Candidatus Zixiibacteriota bacterium]|nr:MAG: terpene cyclase/mutase family protein [candidate division Zixibacteria bacterium]